MINDYYLSELDLSLLRDFVLSNGVRRTYGKGEYLVCQGERRPLVGLITDGLFRHTHTDAVCWRIYWLLVWTGGDGWNPVVEEKRGLCRPL